MTNSTAATRAHALIRRLTWAPTRRRPAAFPGETRTSRAPLGLLSPAGEHALGVAVGLGAAGEDQLQGGLEALAALEVLRHRGVAGLVRVLLVDQRGHAGEGV